MEYFCLWSSLALFIYPRDQQSLAAHCQGRPATANSQNHEVFKQEGDMGTGEDMTYLPRDRSWPSHNLGKVKLLHLPHIPWYFQGKLLAAKAPLYPRHCLAHTPWRKCWNSLVPSTGRSYQVFNPADWVRKGLVSISESWNRTRESAWSGGAASKTMSTGTDESLSLCNSFKQLGLKQVLPV